MLCYLCFKHIPDLARRAITREGLLAYLCSQECEFKLRVVENVIE